MKKNFGGSGARLHRDGVCGVPGQHLRSHLYGGRGAIRENAGSEKGRIGFSSRRAVMVVNASQDKICRARISFGGKNAFTEESYLSSGAAKIYEL